MLAKVRAFVRERFAFGELLERAYDEQIEGGPRWGHVFVNTVAVMLAVQTLTGIFMMLTYVPDVDSAWSSVFYLQHRVTHGWFIRGLHAWGGQALLIVLSLHLLTVVYYGAYRKPREGQFWMLLIMLHLVLGALISGLRLPWDQMSYWALWVELNIAASMPVVGQPLYELIAGGPTLGQSTLTRLYAIHVVVLPLVMFKILAFSWWMRKKHGRAPPAWVKPGASAASFPGQWARDLGFVVVVLGAVALVTTMMHGGAALEAPADPSHDYPARPEWFLLPLFELRKLLPASLEIVATAVIPGAIVGFLFALPFLDKRPVEKPLTRVVWLVPLMIIGVGLGVLTQMSMASDAADDDFQESRVAADLRAARAIELAGYGVPPEGPLYMLEHDPMTRGREIYAQYCASCHILNGEGESKAPDHTGYASREWLVALMNAPQDDHFFGNAELTEDMPSQSRLGQGQLRATAEFLFSLGREPQDPDDIEADLVAAGWTQFESKCMNCHTYEDDGDFLGLGAPNLTHYGSRTWIYRQIHDPGASTQYGELNDMPAFDDQLTPHDIQMVTAFLRLQRFEAIDFEVEPEDEEDDGGE
jgi:ubiquinol-cytochrome c reductase cytochrome b subunit